MRRSARVRCRTDERDREPVSAAQQQRAQRSGRAAQRSTTVVGEHTSRDRRPRRSAGVMQRVAHRRPLIACAQLSGRSRRSPSAAAASRSRALSSHSPARALCPMSSPPVPAAASAADGAPSSYRSTHLSYLEWQRSVPALYDLCMSYGLTWPSLSAQWLPTEPITHKPSGCVTHQMLIGTYTQPGCQPRNTQPPQPQPHCRGASQQTLCDSRSHSRFCSAALVVFSLLSFPLLCLCLCLWLLLQFPTSSSWLK